MPFIKAKHVLYVDGKEDKRIENFNMITAPFSFTIHVNDDLELVAIFDNSGPGHFVDTHNLSEFAKLYKMKVARGLVCKCEYCIKP